MNNTIKLIVAGVAVLVVGFILGTLATYKAPVASNLGAVSYDELNQVGKLRVGMNGSQIGTVVFGTCNLVGVSNDTIAATSTKIATCAASQAKSGDTVFVALPYNATSATSIANVSASSTAGVISVVLRNNGAATAVTTIGTTTRYMIVR